ncbi:efflux RND transporter periplasmic adaptor subunit, partial [Rhizobium johnstonii]
AVDGPDHLLAVLFSQCAELDRDIKVADFTGDGVHVTEGIDTGDLVVSAGTQFMSENLKVKVPDQQSALAATDQTVR